MARFIFLPLMAVALAFVQPFPGFTQTGGEVPMLVEGNNAFASDLYSKLAAEGQGNLFFSPYSLSTALAMTHAGARGQTASEMAKTLHFPSGDKAAHAAFAQLIRDINGNDADRKYQLTVANRLWGQKGYMFDPGFVALTERDYGAGLKEVDFVNATEEARRTINAWVEEQTKEKIKDLIGPGVLSSTARLVLTNAIYFKAAWESPFEPKATKTGDFKLPGGKTVANVPLMVKNLNGLKYLDADGVQIAALPYEKRDLGMVVLLPKDVDGLAKVEKTIATTPGYLTSALAKLKAAPQVRVTLPKFKMTSQFRLDIELAAMGMPTAFSSKADFSGIDTREPLQIGAVLHKAFVDVNEVGTEAAAATAVIMRLAAARVEAIDFRADHPFVFLILDHKTGSILFMGRVMNPLA